MATGFASVWMKGYLFKWDIPCGTPNWYTNVYSTVVGNHSSSWALSQFLFPHYQFRISDVLLLFLWKFMPVWYQETKAKHVLNSHWHFLKTKEGKNKNTSLSLKQFFFEAIPANPVPG